jgi:pilus assembly protein Flp/PilA
LTENQGFPEINPHRVRMSEAVFSRARSTKVSIRVHRKTSKTLGPLSLERYQGVIHFRRILLRVSRQIVRISLHPFPPGGTMVTLKTNLFLYVRGLIEREEGQDLVEYALVVALIAFGAIVSMNFLASGINTAFSDVAATLTSNVT